MMGVISKMLDDLADRLEAKGCVKEATELDVISNTIDASGNVHIFTAIDKNEVPQVREILKKYYPRGEVWVADDASMYKGPKNAPQIPNGTPGIVGDSRADLSAFWNEMRSKGLSK